jgi:hypothetical protein
MSVNLTVNDTVRSEVFINHLIDLKLERTLANSLLGKALLGIILSVLSNLGI